MKIGISDSGLGGLSVLADVEASLQQAPQSGELELLYLNAAPEDEYAYNSMPTRQEKLDTFDRFLDSIANRYAPDFLYLACNTLSILYPDTHFAAHSPFPVLGIVDTGVQRMVQAWRKDPQLSFIIFATETTIGEGTYDQRLREFGVPPHHIVGQVCHGLADAISNDFSGLQAMDLLGEYIPSALEKFEAPPKHVAAYLGCTHYAYQAELFRKGLKAHVDSVRLINPNPLARETILASLGEGVLATRPSVEFITRYPIPEAELNSLSQYLGEQAPDTLKAFQNYTLVPDLF